jgi:hypothetical protein
VWFWHIFVPISTRSYVLYRVLSSFLCSGVWGLFCKSSGFTCFFYAYLHYQSSTICFHSEFGIVSKLLSELKGFGIVSKLLSQLKGFGIVSKLLSQLKGFGIVSKLLTQLKGFGIVSKLLTQLKGFGRNVLLMVFYKVYVYQYSIYRISQMVTP